MIALIDLDPLPYAYGGLTFEDGELLPDSLLQRKIDEKLKDIQKRAGCESFRGYLTDSSSNFRNHVATILPYKGNRSGNPKPPKWDMLRQYLLDTYPDQVKEVVGYEADDQLAIDQWIGWMEDDYSWCPITTPNHDWKTIICSPDKDLMMVPGWHYNWQHDEKKFVTEIEGLRFFYKQLLTGDMTDNIKGLYGVGPKSTLVKKLDDLYTEEEMFNHVFSAYQDRFGSYAMSFIIENGRLLWMLRTEDDDWSKVAEDYIHKEYLKEKQEDDDIPF